MWLQSNQLYITEWVVEGGALNIWKVQLQIVVTCITNLQDFQQAPTLPAVDL